MRNHWAIIFYYIVVRLILNIFFKALYISQNTTKFGSQNFGYQIWFSTRLLMICFCCITDVPTVSIAQAVSTHSRRVPPASLYPTQMTPARRHPRRCTTSPAHSAAGPREMWALRTSLLVGITEPLWLLIHAGLILGLRPANERWRYFVTTSLIGWAQT